MEYQSSKYQDAKNSAADFWAEMAFDPNQSAAKKFLSVTASTLASLLPTNTGEIALLAGPGLLGTIKPIGELSEIVNDGVLTDLRTSGGAANSATAAALADTLASRMLKPLVSDTKLAGLMDDLYRDGAKIGTGSTADAVPFEIATGNPVGGVFHTQKAQDYSKALQRWLEVNPTAATADRSAAQNVLRDLQNALTGKP